MYMDKIIIISDQIPAGWVTVKYGKFQAFLEKNDTDFKPNLTSTWKNIFDFWVKCEPLTILSSSIMEKVSFNNSVEVENIFLCAC